MNKAIAFLLPALLGGCAGSGFAPLEGMPAALGETVRVGSLTATPRSVVEDSRCPITVQCVQAGRVIVSTQITGPGGTETVPLVLGEPYAVQGATVTLVSARPEKWNERKRPRREYRFVFDSGA
jgi:hypothetical protein